MNSLTNKLQPPKIGAYWVEYKGIYAGISKGEHGESDGHIVLLDAIPGDPMPEADSRNWLNGFPGDELNWAEANDWAINLGSGARLPTVTESYLVAIHLWNNRHPTPAFNINCALNYWIAAQHGPTHAIIQCYATGSQGVIAKTRREHARAIFRIAV